MSFNAQQPRHPSGTPQGGQWAGGQAKFYGADPNEDPNDYAATERYYAWADKERESWHALEREMGGGKYPKTHDLVRGPGAGIWGESHTGSSETAGHSAAMMGIEGYKTWATHPDAQKPYKKLANTMLTAIAKSPGSEETLFHGTQGLDTTKWKPGDTFKLPLTATAGEPDTVSYGIASRENQRNMPTLIIFEKGTKMAAYNKWKGKDARDFRHVYSEAIVAGKFKVTGIEQVVYPHNNTFGKMKINVNVVRVKQTGFFNPETGEWEDIGD